MTNWDYKPRDHTFGPAVQAAVERAAEHRAAGRIDEWDFRKDEERARNASTDPNWPPPDLGWRHPDANVEPTHRQSDGLMHTLDPPTADPLSPFQRAELERILLDLDVARERLRNLLERA